MLHLLSCWLLDCEMCQLSNTFRMFWLLCIGLQYFASFVSYKLDYKNVGFSSPFLDLFTRKKNNLYRKNIFWVCFHQACNHGGIWGQCLKYFCAPQIVSYPGKCVLSIPQKQDSCPPKMYFVSPNLKTRLLACFSPQIYMKNSGNFSERNWIGSSYSKD